MTDREQQSGDGSSSVSADKDLAAGRGYRFRRFTIPIVLRDMYFKKDDPGPGDRVPDFDLPTLGGGASGLQTWPKWIRRFLYSAPTRAP